MIPRGLVIGIVIVLTGLLTLDVGGQFFPGSTHEASPVLDAAILAILGATVAASRGPVPPSAPPNTGELPAPPATPAVEPPPAPRPDGPRHRAPGDPT